MDSSCNHLSLRQFSEEKMGNYSLLTCYEYISKFFCDIFAKGDRFCDFLFASLVEETFI